MLSQHGICSVNHVMTSKGALMRLTANSASRVMQIMQGQQNMSGTVIIHSNTPINESSDATNMKGNPMRNPRGLHSQPILPCDQLPFLR